MAQDWLAKSGIAFRNVLARATSKSPITLPKAVMSRFAGVKYFDGSADGECVAPRPLWESRSDEVRAKLAKLGVDERDVADAVDWVRKSA